MEDSKKPHILFQYHKYSIDSCLSFDDGDFILMITGNAKDCPILYDGKTLKPKLNLRMKYERLFILDSHQIGIFSKLKFELYNLNEDRTEIKFDQTILPKGSATGLNLKKLSNNDLLLSSFYLGSYDVAVYRKVDNIYEIQNQFLTADLDEIFEINKDEVLGYKLSSSPEFLTFKVLSNDNYKLIRKNEIPFILKDKKRRIYLSQPIIIYKLSEDKLISFGSNKIYIFDIKTLELETTIKILRYIIKVLKRPKGNILLFTCNHYLLMKNGEYYLNNIKFDLKNNEIIFDKEKNITNELGEHKTIFDFFNYKENGFVTITDNNNIIIYDNYYF
jgi:hypothetical protein